MGIVRGSKGGDIADVVEGRSPPEHGLSDHLGNDLVPPVEWLRDRLGNSARQQGDDANAMRPQFAGQAAPERLDGAERDLQATEVRGGIA